MIFASLMGCGGSSAERPESVTRPDPEHPTVAYEVRGTRADPARLEIEACVRGFSTKRFSLLEGDGIEEAWSRGRPLIVERGRGVPVDSTGASPTCVTYQVRPDPSVRPGFVDDGAVLARPEGAPRAARVSVRFEGTAADFTTPYPTRDGLHRPRPSFLTRSTTWARVGEGILLEREVGQTALRLAILAGTRRLSDEDLVRHFTRAVSLASGLSPERYPRTLLVAVAPGRVREGEGPIAFGLARRGGGASVLLVLDEAADASALESSDWVALHELAHFAFPAMPRSEAWLTEGWATYFQEVLRARGGLSEDADVFERLHRGFARGRAEGTGRPLYRESKEMWSTYAFERVYWSGAALALEDDVSLHARGSSLEGALTRAFEGASFDDWIDFDEYLGRLERSGLGQLAARAREARVRTEFPDLSSAYEALGLRARGDALIFGGDDASVSARRAIVSGGRP